MTRGPESSETEATELLRTLIRNACVNDGTPASGHEDRNCRRHRGLPRGLGPPLRALHGRAGPRQPHHAHRGQRQEGAHPPAHGPHGRRARQCARAGSAIPSAASWWTASSGAAGPPTCCTSRRRWRWPCGGSPRAASRPRGTLIYLARGRRGGRAAPTARAIYADEKFDAVKADYVITESGGVPIPTRSGVKLPVTVGEKGINWRRLVIKGTPGHGSMPFRTDNALVTAAEVVRRVAVVPAQGAHPRRVAPLRLRARAGARARGGARRSRPRAGGGAPPRAAGVRAPRARLHPHDVLPQRGAGRVEDQRHPRPHRHRRRCARAARRHAPRRRRDAEGGPRRHGLARRDRGPARPGGLAHARSTRRSPTPSRA